MKDLKIYIDIIEPSKSLTPQLIQEQFEWRKSLTWSSLCSQIVIADIKEPVWWNRPVNPDTLLKQEPDGLYSYNLPFVGDPTDFKTGYNLLLNKNSIPLGVHIKLNPTWDSHHIEALSKMIVNSVYSSLVELGVEAEDLSRKHNDLLYKGKKFMGEEQKLANGVFSENAVITLAYKPEEKIFQRLTGKYALTRGITGIMEETRCFTKQQFIEKLLEKIAAFIKTLD